MAADDERRNRQQEPRPQSPKEDVFSVVVNGQGFMAPAVAAAPAPAARLLIAGKETTEGKKERKGKKNGNRAADSTEDRRVS